MTKNDLKKCYLKTGLPLEIRIKQIIQRYSYTPQTTFFEDKIDNQSRFRELDVYFGRMQYQDITPYFKLQFIENYLVSCKNTQDETFLFFYSEPKEGLQHWALQLPIYNRGRIGFSEISTLEYFPHQTYSVQRGKMKKDGAETGSVLWEPTLELATATNYFMREFYRISYMPFLIKEKERLQEIYRRKGYDPEAPREELGQDYEETIRSSASRVRAPIKMMMPVLVYSDKVSFYSANRFEISKDERDFEEVESFIFYMMPPIEKSKYLRNSSPFPIIVCKEKSFEATLQKLDKINAAFKKELKDSLIDCQERVRMIRSGISEAEELV